VTDPHPTTSAAPDLAPTAFAADTRDVVVRIGGAFMTSDEFTEVEAGIGLPQRMLYFRGRSAVLGDPSPAVVTETLGIFPAWVVGFAAQAAGQVAADKAVATYSQACWNWGRAHLVDAVDPARTAELLFRITDTADASALLLFAGWREAARPTEPAEALAHALMLTRELRGGLHFAALRASGLSVTEAVVADPGGGKARLLRTAWSPEAADELVAKASRKADLTERWQHAESLTDLRFGEAAADALNPTELAELRDRLLALA
jgi:hypothetical protein